MDTLIAGVTIALYGYVIYVVMTTPVGVVGPFSDEVSAPAEIEASAEAAVAETAEVAAEAAVAEATTAADEAAEPVAEVEASAEETQPVVPETPVEEVAAAEVGESEAVVVETVAATTADSVSEEASEVVTSGTAIFTLRHPTTGETAIAPANYRFAKNWVKKALVTEGLLDKVYKNNELDSATSEKVKVALEKFKTLTQYHG